MCRLICAGGRLPERVKTLIFSLLTAVSAFSQPIPDGWRQALEALEGDGYGAEALAEHVDNLIQRRPNINSLGREGLLGSAILSPFQVEGILEYRARCGDILSWGELLMIEGFNASQAALCGACFRFESRRASAAADTFPLMRGTLTTRIRWTLQSPSPAFVTKYRIGHRDGFSVGFTADHDSGEGLRHGFIPDFMSGFAAWERPAQAGAEPAENGAVRLESLILGDFSVRFGQGLTVWKSPFPAIAGEPSSLMKRPSGSRPYTSTDESNFFRGAAASLSLGPFRADMFVSYNALDARLSADTAYISLPSGGYHRTESQLAARRTMREGVFGISLSRSRGRWRVALNGIGYRYNKANAMKPRADNEMRQYDGLWGNVGIDVRGSWRRLRIFGEAALDASATPALLAGVLWSPFYGFEAALTGRLYPPSYTATHAGALSNLSCVANQEGIDMELRYMAGRIWTFSASGEFTGHPAPRYGIATPSDRLKWRIGAERGPKKGISASFRLDGREYAVYTAAGRVRDSVRVMCRLGLSIPFSERCSLSFTALGDRDGNGACSEFSWGNRSGSLGISARITGYSTMGWDSRIWLYERGVPQSFGVKCLYGKGAGGYLLLKYSPGRRSAFYLKLSESGADYFMRIFIPG